ncbi:tRNA 2-selenouridine synthase [Sporosarcina sp. NCCP-2222]|uniref:tRNA 2-selenouridine(34) synthase MnmH n=1 Tax=Sporosarcina sp. NCCP-2222 TaxID=2935073 RepID=UPI00207FE4C3|nr:tRNA 2-selenouridine(34) synthase MnmH [Sporosarcina sp. NCCP-2222]GKV57453.1 tRNA 2-selenouridine synthase [Sporosarcina sp. NCCP-2222]
MIRDISLEDLMEMQQHERITTVDVRSPKEYEEATIPGSLNIPVFNDEERAEIGTLYKQVSPEAAKERGLEIFSQKLPSFIKAFKEIDGPTTVFCWRGGMRSKTAATVLELMGIHVNRLSGGIRTYRQWIVKELEKEDFPPEFIVLDGYTGTGKTTILRQLDKQGLPILDIEQLAGHRGSIFGQIGLQPNNQKKFDSLLVHEMKKLRDKRFVLIEGESKRIGKVLLPPFLFNKKENGRHVIIHLPIEQRVQNILDDYEPWNSPDQFLDAFQLIKKRVKPALAVEIEAHLANEEFKKAVELLLLNYYDPRYEHSAFTKPGEAIVVHAADTEEALTKVAEIYESAIASVTR